MKYLKIEKFIDSQHEKTLQIPFFIFLIALKLLPKKAIFQLSEKGVNFDKIIAAYKQKTPYSCTIYVAEKKINKCIIISI